MRQRPPKQSKSNFTEEKFVSWLTTLNRPSDQSCIVTGIGDDAAVVKVTGEYLVLTTDAVVEDVHFKREWSAMEDIGWKAMAVNVSDMAAMGVAPQWALVTAGFPASANVSELKSAHKGLSSCASAYGVRLVGGDTVKSDKWFINVAMGGTTKEKPLLRSGAREGDYIFVTGTLGNAACALELLKKKNKKFSMLLPYHKKPHARLKEGLALMKTGCISSMMDISDGLSKDLARLLKESGAGAKIFKQQIPLSVQTLKASSALRKNSYDFALHGGEDYEILFTVSREKLSSFYETFYKLLTPENLTSLIGEITLDKRYRIILIDGHKSSVLKSGGYDHLSSLKT